MGVARAARRVSAGIGACAAAAAMALVGAAASTAPQPTLNPRGDWPVRFVDIAAEAGLTHPTTYGDAARKRFIIETNGCGVATIDVDDDGWLDLVTLNGTQLEPGDKARPCVAAGPGTDAAGCIATCAPVRRRHAHALGLDRVGWASGVCAGDATATGASTVHHLLRAQHLYRNRGGGRFEDVRPKPGSTAAATRWGSGCSLLDIDRDGDLDLFVANYLSLESGHGAGAWTGPELPLEGCARELRARRGCQPIRTSSIATTGSAPSSTSRRHPVSLG